MNNTAIIRVLAAGSNRAMSQEPLRVVIQKNHNESLEFNYNSVEDWTTN